MPREKLGASRSESEVLAVRGNERADGCSECGKVDEVLRQRKGGAGRRHLLQPGDGCLNAVSIAGHEQAAGLTHEDDVTWDRQLITIGSAAIMVNSFPAMLPFFPDFDLVDRPDAVPTTDHLAQLGTTTAAATSVAPLT